jgi:hypothetical protein
MAWKYNDTYIRAGRSWVGTATDEEGNTFDVTHPRNWMIWSDEDKAAAGLVWEDDPAPFDNRFWWDANTPKALDDVNEVDEDGNPVIDPITNQQRVALGLKSQYKNEIKTTASVKLQPTDWMVIKAAEVADYTVPADVTTYRAAVRTASNTIETSIDGAADHTAFVALFDTPVDADGNPTGNAPIYDWPEEV